MVAATSTAIIGVDSTIGLTGIDCSSLCNLGLTGGTTGSDNATDGTNFTFRNSSKAKNFREDSSLETAIAAMRLGMTKVEFLKGGLGVSMHSTNQQLGNLATSTIIVSI